MNARYIAVRVVDSPLPWALGGLIVGGALGVTALSVWLLVAGFVGYLANLWLRGPAKDDLEGRLVAAGPILLIAWVCGFVIRGVIE